MGTPVRVTKEFSIAYGHLLTNYDGKCADLHGHNAKISVTVEGSPSEIKGFTDEGMLIDFSDLKSIVQEVISPLDHKFLACGDEWIVEAALDYDKKYPRQASRFDKIVVLGFRTTAENLVRWVAEHVQDRLPIECKLVAVSWWETDTSYATFLV